MGIYAGPKNTSLLLQGFSRESMEDISVAPVVGRWAINTLMANDTKDRGLDALLSAIIA